MAQVTSDRMRCSGSIGKAKRQLRDVGNDEPQLVACIRCVGRGGQLETALPANGISWLAPPVSYKVRSAVDSPVEEDGAEPSVPRLQWSSVQLAARDATDATPERRSFASTSLASDFRMPDAPFTWTKAGVELEVGFRDFVPTDFPRCRGGEFAAGLSARMRF